MSVVPTHMYLSSVVVADDILSVALEAATDVVKELESGRNEIIFDILVSYRDGWEVTIYYK